MDDETIEQLSEAVKRGNVWWLYGDEVKQCMTVIKEWIEQYSDGSFAATSEPVVQFMDGTCAALWLSDRSEFMTMNPLWPNPDCCEHGVADGDFCETCRAAYRAAEVDPENGLVDQDISDGEFDGEYEPEDAGADD